MKTGTVWTRIAGAAAVCAALGVPAAAQAQRTLDSVYVVATANGRADQLDSSAVALYGSPKKWRQAAYLHQMAADLRSPEDPRRAESLSMAGNLFAHIGDLQAARHSFEKAAALAEARGDVVRAAWSYVDAGYVALSQRGNDAAVGYARKAQTLAASPLLTEEQRSSITKRMGYSQVVATLSGSVAP